MTYSHYRSGSGYASASPAENDLLAYANVCRASPSHLRSQSASPASITSQRSASPKFNIADFESNAQSRVNVATSRETSYASQANIDDLDFARSSGSNTPVVSRPNLSRNLNTGTSFLKRSASKLLPRAIATANLPTPPSSTPNSGASSPTKSLSSFITGTVNSSTLPSISSSASKASVRAKTASRVLFDNYFNGDSNNVLQPYHSHSRSNSVASTANTSQREDGYEPDSENMASPTYFTRAPERTRPRRSPTSESIGGASTYAGKLGSWFTKQSSPKAPSASQAAAAEAQSDDPLLNLDTQAALFPYGPVDPLNPHSFNDLLSAAEALISTYQNAYKQRVAELAQIKAEAALKEDELEECETRAMHLKSQLQDMAEQNTALTQKNESLEAMVRERPATSASDVFESSSTLVGSSTRVRQGEHAGSDSGFESDGDSVFSATPVKPAAAKHNEFSMVTPSRPQYSNDLRTENEMLRQRVIELEGAVDSCLDMISNPLAL